MKFNKPSDVIEAGYGFPQYSIKKNARLWLTDDGYFHTPVEFDGLIEAEIQDTNGNHYTVMTAKTEDIIKAAIT